MIIRTNIMIDQAVKETGQRVAKNLQLRGKFSEYVEMLIKADLKKRGEALLIDSQLKEKEVA